MKIYTSYFAGKKKGVPVGIARRPPKWFIGLNYTKLAPASWMLNASVSQAEYEKAFAEILKLLNPHKVVEELQALTGNSEEITLLCYEKIGDFCHRHLVAFWLMEAGYHVDEVGQCCAHEFETKKAPREPIQFSLF